jgi:hypothetical protein
MIAVIGGTGAFGQGLIMRWALAGEDVMIGSRSQKKAKGVAAEINEKIGKLVRSGTNLEAARKGDILVLSVPFEAMKKIVKEIKPALNRNKILVNVAVPLKFGRGTISIKQPKAGSTAEELKRLVPKGVKVVSAFQTVGAKELQEVSKPVDCDIVVCGDDERAKKAVMRLTEKIAGVRAVDGGPLRNSRYLEPIVALLIELMRRRGVSSVGIRFKGF